MQMNFNPIYDYHNRTKHAPMRYAASLGYMDWESQPDPFRYYEPTTKVRLPLLDEKLSISYQDLFNGNAPKAPLCLESISELLRYSFGLAAKKSYDGVSYYLRCNASSGNLHPSECYLVLPPIEGISTLCSISHYNPKEHALEILATFESSHLKEGSFLLSIASIYWREAWKYGERAFRYISLDTGHAMRAVEISAKMLGLPYTREYIDVDSHNALYGFNKQVRFNPNEREDAEVMLNFGHIDVTSLLAELHVDFNSNANTLSRYYHRWEIIDTIADATKTFTTIPSYETPKASEHLSGYSAKSVILSRRSAQMMDKEDSTITFEQFEALLMSIKEEIMGRENSVSLAIFVHNVDNLASGLYYFVRHRDDIALAKSQMKATFVFEAIEAIEGLYLLQKGDFRVVSKTISCNQSIASDGAFSLAMLARFDERLSHYGAAFYKELYYECGAIGQQLYLEATSLRLSATGIGCFLDDSMHDLLGIANSSFVDMYHFTIGRALHDSRISTTKPYDEA